MQHAWLEEILGVLKSKGHFGHHYTVTIPYIYNQISVQQ